MAGKGEIQLPNEPDEPVVFKGIPPAVMQAIYHEATGKTEKIQRDYKDCFIVERGDIEQLAYRIAQTAQQYDITAASEKVIVDHYQNDTVRYSSFEKFQTYSDNNPHPISQIVLQWKFLLSVPMVKLYHEYQVNVSIDSFVRDEDSPIYTVYAGRFAPPAVAASVDFVDYVVARAFHTTIEEWVRTLRKRRVNPFVVWVERIKTSVWYFAPWIVAFSALFAWGGIWGLAGQWAPAIDARYPLFVTLMAGVMIFGGVLAMAISEFILDPLKSYCRAGSIRINRGDAASAEAIEREISQGPLRAVGGIIALTVQIIANLMATTIIGWL